MRQKLLAVIGVAGMLAGLVLVGAPSQAADHLDAPLVQADGRTDINDVYVFRSPDNPDNVVLIMTVNPVAGGVSPTTFDPKAEYRFLIDTDGDAREDEKISVKFGKVKKDGTQKVKIKGAAGKGKGRTGGETHLGGKPAQGRHLSRCIEFRTHAKQIGDDKGPGQSHHTIGQRVHPGQAAPVQSDGCHYGQHNTGRQGQKPAIPLPRGRKLISKLLNQYPHLVVAHCLHNLCLSVHHKGAVCSNLFANRLTSQNNRPGFLNPLYPD